MDEYVFYNDNDYLIHHGIKGMKLGVRRFQKKKDGSLTPAGKKRYDENTSSINTSSVKQKSSHRQKL